MTSRALDLHDSRLLVDRITEHPKLAAVVPRLPPALVYGMVRAIGLEDSGAIVVHATPDQLTRVFDEDLWAALSSGNDAFDPSRFGTWLDVLVDADPGVAARALAALDRDFVVGALSHHVLVVERAWVATGAAFVDPEVSGRGRAAIRALLDEGLTSEFGALLVIGTSRHSWDAVIAVLRALQADHDAAFHDILFRCGKATFTWLAAAGGPSSAGRLQEPVMAAARDERRDAAGFVTAADARAFLDRARQAPLAGARLERDAVTQAYFRDVAASFDPRLLADPAPRESRAGSPGGAESEQELLRVVLEIADAPGPRQPLLAGATRDSSRYARLSAHVGRLQDEDGPAYLRCLGELTYLVNVVGAGACFQDRRPTPHESRDVVLATCTLGLENWPAHWNVTGERHGQADLVSLFAVGWTIVHERVALPAARGLRNALADLRIDDGSLALQVAETRARLERALASGATWQVRPHLDVVSLLDQVSWFVLSALLDECPAIPPSLYSPVSSAPVLRVSTDLEFISENAQIAWADDYVASLSARLVG